MCDRLISFCFRSTEMDPTKPYPKKLQYANKANRPHQVAYTQSHSKQTPNTTNSNDRKIKQIVPLDSKKIKTLGIEQTILSALTKFNGKDRSLAKAKPSKSAQHPSSKSSSSSLSASLSSLLVKRPQIESPVPLHISTSITKIASVPLVASSKSPETPSTKKIHVLSNVLLNEHKLSLKDFTAIASSTPVNSTNVSYVSQVPNHGELPVPVKCEAVKFEDDGTFASNTIDETTELITADDYDESMIEIETNIEDEDFKEIEIVEEQIENNAVRSLQKQSSEIDSLKGFSSNDLRSSRNKCQYLQNEISSQSAMSSTHSESGSEAAELCEISSDNESDLEELEREAQRIIELNELESDAVTAVDQQSPILENEDSIDSISEHIDKERLIDEFLDSTINSFHIPFAADTNDDSEDTSSDSSSEHDVHFDTNDHNEYDDLDEDEQGSQMIEITEIDLVKEERVEEQQLHDHETNPPMSQKRKSSDRSENNFGQTKRKKSNTISDIDEISRDDMIQSQEPKEAINERVQTPTEIHQGKITLYLIC